MNAGRCDAADDEAGGGAAAAATLLACADSWAFASTDQLAGGCSIDAFACASATDGRGGGGTASSRARTSDGPSISAPPSSPPRGPPRRRPDPIVPNEKSVERVGGVIERAGVAERGAGTVRGGTASPVGAVSGTLLIDGPGSAAAEAAAAVGGGALM